MTGEPGARLASSTLQAKKVIDFVAGAAGSTGALARAAVPAEPGLS